MKNLFFLLVFTVSSLNLGVAQLTDDFSDGDFTQNPAWEGDTDKFIVSNGELQLMDENPGSSNRTSLALFAPTNTNNNTVWAFKVRLDFSPSASNFARVYLAAQSADFTTNQNAYYLQVGGISGSDDALELYRQDENGNTQLLISGTTAAVGGSSPIASVRISRTVNGEWTLEADYTGNTDYQMEGTSLDSTFDLLNYFGVFCRYSSTRSDKFFFDDISIAPLFQDQTAPDLSNINVLSTDSIQLIFNEPLDSTAAVNTNNYTINNGIGNPQSVLWSANNPSQVILIFGSPLQNQTNYEIIWIGVADASGNIADQNSTTFEVFFTENPELGDLLISEFMANPNGAIGIPEAEYIELYNNSNKVLTLEGIGIASGGSPRFLPEEILSPSEYIIVTNSSNLADFTDLGRVIGVASLPTLSNSGDEIVISLPNGDITQSLVYNRGWYANDEKDDGGFSIERIDFSQPENCPGNWRASQDSRGGSPNAENSIFGTTTEQDAPILQTGFPENTTTIELVFNETLGELMNVSSIYNLSPTISISSAQISGAARDRVILSLATPIQEGVLYQLDLSQTEDCLGNFSDQSQSIALAIPQAIEVGDLLINEVLFNPFSGGKDFVELINISDKVISIKDLELFNAQKLSGNLRTSIDFEQLMLPGQILAITSDVTDLRNRYPIPNGAILVEASLPTLDADEGNISIILNNETLDAFDYSEDLHSPLLDNERGVSLERLSTALGSNNNDNWASAAASVGFATPGYENSQQFNPSPQQEDIFQLDNNTLSPDGDGLEDQLILSYQVDRTGYLANIRVYDASGHPIKTLSRNELLASEGIITWDGSTEEGSKARIGIYVVWIELFTPEGDKQIEKLSCVLAGRL